MPSHWERVGILAALLATPIAIVALAWGYYRWAKETQEEPQLVLRRTLVGQPDPVEQVQRTWKEPPPEFVLAISGQMYGYLQPCGCARPQVGGLERRYELVQRLRQSGWPVVGFDLGDLARLRYEIQQGVPALAEQARLKYETAWKMLHQLGWQAVGIGPEELLFPLDEVLGWALNTRPPVLVSTNLDWPEMLDAGAYQRFWIVEVPVAAKALPNQNATAGSQNVASFDEAASRASPSLTSRTWRIACLCVIQQSQLMKLGEQLTNQRDLLQRFTPVDVALTQAWREIRQRQPDLVILLHHGTVQEAKTLAQKFGWLHVIVNRDESDVASALAQELPQSDANASASGLVLRNRLLIRVGHKGKAIGLVAMRPERDRPLDASSPSGSYRLDYRMVELTEALELPSGKTNPIRELMQDYVYQVYARQLLAQWVAQRQRSHPQQLEQPGAAFVGASACAECHRTACQVWNNSKHSQAYDALVKYGQPQTSINRDGRQLLIGRQYDPECVICHTTGFAFKTGFRSEQETPQLRANGCENCHGPASLHVQFPKDPKYWQPLHRTASANLCISCHDSENDPHFDFSKYWPKIVHKKD